MEEQDKAPEKELKFKTQVKRMLSELRGGVGGLRQNISTDSSIRKGRKTKEENQSERRRQHLTWRRH